MVFFTSRGTPKPSTHIYGVEWDGSSTTVWTRTDESADFDAPPARREQRDRVEPI